MQKELYSGVYCIENINTNKKYIGQSIDVNERWRKHVSELNNNSHHNDYLQKAWNKYGEDSFIFYVLEYCDIEYLDEKEIYYIEIYNTINRDYGYNLKSGGQFTNIYTDELKQKISKSVKESYNNSKLREARKLSALNQWADPDIKAKISGENNGMYGKHHTQETVKKLSEIGKRPKVSKNIRPVMCVELNKEFKNASVAGKELNISSSNILNTCYGKRQTCGGYHWKFINIEEE